jgi:KUP system potassium uptake protein
VCAAVIGFGSSTRLASAYGVSVMGTMLVTTFLTFFVIRYRWGYPLWLCVAATGGFMLVDATFFRRGHAQGPRRRLVPAAAGRCSSSS